MAALGSRFNPDCNRFGRHIHIFYWAGFRRKPSKLARSLSLVIKGERLPVETPLLVPSFSSKALEYARGNTQKVFGVLQESITESVLISAYDLAHKHIEAPDYAFAEVMFLDSGGFEASKDHDLMDPLYPSQNPKDWTLELYQTELDRFESVMPMFISSFDHPLILSGETLLNPRPPEPLIKPPL